MTSLRIPTHVRLDPKERRFALVMALFAALAFILPPFVQPQQYHLFADERTILGIPRAMDVLSNIGFLLAGCWGGAALIARRKLLDPALAWSLGFFFLGVALTSVGSSYYHWAPQDARLVWDRLPMTIAFAGACGAFGTTRVSPKAGMWSLVAFLAYGMGSIVYWRATGNLTPYGVMQFGGLAWIAVAWAAGPRPRVDMPWGALLGFYLAAKLLETFDTAIYLASTHIVSGHTLKHIVAALAAASFARAVWKLGSPKPGP